MKTIAVLAGDGIGPEVVSAALRVLEAVGRRFGFQYRIVEGWIGGAAFDRYGEHFPEETKTNCRNSDAIFFGSVGGPANEMALPKWHDCERNSLLALRREFQFYANLRSLKVYPELTEVSPLKRRNGDSQIDILIVRELLGDIYFGQHESGTSAGRRWARDVAEYNEDQVRQIAVTAFQAARGRRRRIVSVDKANVLETSRLWRAVVTEVSRDYPDVSLEHMLVDNCALQLVMRPESFDVILAPNLFGDILSDLVSALGGSLGLMPSASLNAHGFGLFEPAGGSAPDIAGQGIANPIAQILSLALLLRYSFHQEEAAALIEQAVSEAVRNGKKTRDLCISDETACGTSDFIDEVVKHVETAK